MRKPSKLPKWGKHLYAAYIPYEAWCQVGHLGALPEAVWLYLIYTAGVSRSTPVKGVTAFYSIAEIADAIGADPANTRKAVLALEAAGAVSTAIDRQRFPTIKTRGRTAVTPITLTSLPERWVSFFEGRIDTAPNLTGLPASRTPHPRLYATRVGMLQWTLAARISPAGRHAYRMACVLSKVDAGLFKRDPWHSVRERFGISSRAMADALRRLHAAGLTDAQGRAKSPEKHRVAKIVDKPRPLRRTV